MKDRVQRCVICGRNRPWPDEFLDPSDPTCVVCWLRAHPSKLEPLKRAIRVVERS